MSEKTRKGVQTPAAPLGAEKPEDSASPPAHQASNGPSDDLKASVSETLASAPSPSEAAIAAHLQRQEAREAAEASENETKAGKKRGPYKKSGTGSTLKNPVQSMSQAQVYRKVGASIADTIMLLGQTVGGADWAPVLSKDASGNVLMDEKANMREAWADLAEEYQWEKMPAWAGCAIVTGTYVIPRLMMPSTLSRWDKFKGWLAARKSAGERADKKAV